MGSLTQWHLVFGKGIKSETSGKFDKVYPVTGRAISILGLYLEEIVVNVDHNCRMLLAALWIRAKSGKQSECSSIGDSVNR